MDRPVTRHELYAALGRLLHRKGVEHPEHTVQVLGEAFDGVRLFAIILSGPAKTTLTHHLSRVTGRLHPTVADMWLLDESESLALIQAAGHCSHTNQSRDTAPT